MNVVLCGFMGCGKTTVAKLLAARLNMDCIDLDQYIEHTTGMRVSEIFEKFGEPGFRSYERHAVSAVCKTNNCVIATGGGTVLDAQNAAVLRKSGVIFFLDVSVDTVLARLQNDHSRPLLERSDKEQAIALLLSARLPLYKAACDYSINANGASPEMIAENILSIIKKLDK